MNTHVLFSFEKKNRNHQKAKYCTWLAFLNERPNKQLWSFTLVRDSWEKLHVHNFLHEGIYVWKFLGLWIHLFFYLFILFIPLGNAKLIWKLYLDFSKMFKVIG